MAASQIFLDTEFTGRHQQTTLISLALVSEDGRSFYAEFTDYNKEQVDDWLEQNVLKHLHLKDGHRDHDGLAHSVCGSREVVREALQEFLARFESVRIWGDHLSYDWVLFCELFGGNRYLPEYIDPVPLDFATLLQHHGLNTGLDRYDYAKDISDDEPSGHHLQKHNALYDALILRACYNRLLREEK